MMWWYGGPWAYFGPVMMLMFLLLAGGGLLLLFRTFWHTVERRGEDALSILDQRYARGEISREEYLRMRGELSRRD